MSWILPQWMRSDATTSGLDAAVKDTSSSTDAVDDTSSDEHGIDDTALETDGTPKARPKNTTARDVPAFTLSDDAETEVASNSPPTAPSFPARNSAQRASSRTTPSALASKGLAAPSAGLMPPPGRPAAVPRGNPSTAAASLRVPSTGPLPNRGIPANSQQRVSSSLGVNGAVKTPNSRGKVLLSPGHSPMDWAALTRTGNLAGVNGFRRVTPSELRSMTGRKGKPAWSSWQGKVYNITPYLPFHPGGEGELMKAAGRDGTKLFMDVHPWVNWENMLGSCLVGVMVPEDHGSGQGQSSLEDMD